MKLFIHISNGQDFFDYEPDRWDVMVSNPPFTNKENILREHYHLANPLH